MLHFYYLSRMLPAVHSPPCHLQLPLLVLSRTYDSSFVLYAVSFSLFLKKLFLFFCLKSCIPCSIFIICRGRYYRPAFDVMGEWELKFLAFLSFVFLFFL